MAGARANANQHDLALAMALRPEADRERALELELGAVPTRIMTTTPGSLNLRNASDRELDGIRIHRYMYSN